MGHRGIVGVMRLVPISERCMYDTDVQILERCFITDADQVLTLPLNAGDPVFVHLMKNSKCRMSTNDIIFIHLMLSIRNAFAYSRPA
jgi:hypothetical protein